MINLLTYIMLSVVIITIYYKTHYEHFGNNGTYNPSPNISSFYYEDKTSLPRSASILSRKNKGFGNFGKFGVIPMMQSCSKCQLNDNCSNFDYNKSDTQVMNVCQSCDINTCLDAPYYVSARSAGRPRQCRRIMD